MLIHVFDFVHFNLNKDEEKLRQEKFRFPECFINDSRDPRHEIWAALVVFRFSLIHVYPFVIYFPRFKFPYLFSLRVFL